MTYMKWGADLTLSGHLHGGIVRIPGLGGVITSSDKIVSEVFGRIDERR
ncbi:MAG: hypothetical protein ACLTKE_09820 [Coprococcus sp.]